MPAPLIVFGTIPNGQTIPLSYLDDNFSNLQNQITGFNISGGTTGMTFGNISGVITMSGTLGISNGGTGATTQSAAATAILPSQSGNGGKFLTTDGSSVSWATTGGGGGVTAIVNGGTGATTATQAMVNLLPSQTSQGGKFLTTDGSGNLSWAAAGVGANLVVGTSAITGGNTGRILFDNGGVLGEKAVQGSGDVVLATAPVVTNPVNVGTRERQTTAIINAGVLNIDCSVGNVLSITLSSNISNVTFSGLPAITEAYSVILSFTADGTSRSINWPGTVRWPNSTPPVPTATAGKVDTYVLYTYDGGLNWFGFISGQNA